MPSAIVRDMSKPSSICANCKHRGLGEGVDERQPQPGQRLNPIRLTTGLGDIICLRHPRGRTPIDPITGMGDVAMGLYCEDVNTGNCPDYERGFNTDDFGKIVFFAACGLSVAAIVTFLLFIGGNP